MGPDLRTAVGIPPLPAPGGSGHSRGVDKHYLVDWTLPPAKLADLRAAHRAIDEAGRRLTADGEPVRCLHSTYVPAQRRWLCIFSAVSDDAIRKAHEIAQLPVPRVVEAVDLAQWERQPS